MVIKKTILKVIYILITVYLLTFLPILWGQKPLVVISGSMEPTLKVGSILYYHEEKINNFSNNDILVYKTKSHIISHRIVNITENGFVTKGDMNKSTDTELINKQQVLGKATNWCIPYLGYYADFIYTHKYLLFISISILVIDLGYDYFKKRKKKVGVYYEKN